jgi:thiol-disulfide isomerase/thioredoxin
MSGGIATSVRRDRLDRALFLRKLAFLLPFFAIAGGAMARASLAETPFAAVFFQPGPPDFGPAKRLPLTELRSASLPVVAEIETLDVIWGRDSDGKDVLWLLRRTPGEGGVLDLLSTRPGEFGTLSAQTHLKLQSGSDARADLELRLLPYYHQTLLYRWSGGASSPGGTPRSGVASLVIGQPLPSFTVTGADGKPIAIPPPHSGFLVLNSWASWCIPCVEELPSLDRLVAKWSGRGVRFVAIAKDEAKRVAEFLHDRSFPYEQTFAAQSSALRLGDEHPRHVVVDTKGVVRFDTTGGSKDILTTLDRALNDIVGN